LAPFTLFVWLLTCAIWSTVWLFIKLGVRDVPPVAFAVFRMSIALAVLLPATLARRTPLPRTRAEWLLIASTGFVLLGVNYALLNWGIQFISSGLTAVLQATTPVFGFVFAHVLLRDEKMTAWKGLALAMGVAGVGIIFRDQLDAPQRRALSGSIAVTAGAACVAIAYVVMKRHGTKLHPSVITSGQLLSAVIPLGIYSAVVEGPPLSLPRPDPGSLKPMWPLRPTPRIWKSIPPACLIASSYSRACASIWLRGRSPRGTCTFSRRMSTWSKKFSHMKR
jgi:drug/metabolite transporter (DMT)-like permease